MNALPTFTPERPAPPALALASLAGPDLRAGQVLGLDETSAEPDAESCRRIALRPPSPELRRLTAFDTLALRRPAYIVRDGGTGLLLTYVLRHSPAGLRWRDSHGDSARLAPGAFLLSQSGRDTLVELSPAVLDEPCECVRVMFHADAGHEMAARAEGEDLSFCNSPEACVRVVLGRYRDRAAAVAPMAGLSVLDLDLAPGSALSLPVAAGHWALALITTGTLTHPQGQLEAGTALAFYGEAPAAALASATGASLLWLNLPYAAATALPAPGYC